MTMESLRQVFADLDAQLARAEVPSPGPDLESSPVTAEGTAADERLRVTVTNGRVQEVSLQPQLLRLSNAELGDHIAEAVNNALEAYQTALMAQLSQLSPDLGAVREQVRQIQEESIRSLDAYTDSMLQMLRQVKQ
ncbi:MAG: YbaB/EbfC family nucleoid-associated protein [Actinomycetia bacterium]|nr:YbaB/EbfC family nucleoid-associated protein [Actinomycetes bacterium]